MPKCEKCLQEEGHEAWCPDKYTGGVFDEQVGGSHYKSLAIDPIIYAHLNKLTPAEHAVIKYATRHRFKNGVEDLRKALHCIRLEAKLTYGEDI